MTVEHDPRNVDAALSDLRAWSDALPEYDLEAGVARHVALLDASASPPPGGVAAVVRRGWWIAGASAVLVLGLVTALRDDAPVRAAAPVLSPLPVSRGSQPTPPTPAAATIATASAMPAEIEPAALRPASRRAPRPRATPKSAIEPASAPVDSDAVERELAVVRRLRRLLAESPERVPIVAAEAEREFGRGVFGEERAALRVFALAKLGDAHTEAEAAAFLREFGEGPFATKVARVRDGEGSPAGAQ